MRRRPPCWLRSRLGTSSARSCSIWRAATVGGSAGSWPRPPGRGLWPGGPSPPPDATAVGDVDGGVAGSPSGVATTHGAATGAALQTGAGAFPAIGAWRPALTTGGSGAAGPQSAGALAPGSAGGGGAVPSTPDKTYVMGSFASCEKGPDAWRRWICWHGDLRPLRFVATGVHPEILEASTDDVAELRADLGDTRLSAADFDERRRARLARVWIDEAPSQVDFVLAQLGVGTWANDTVAPCGWGNLPKGCVHRFRTPWTPAELEAALRRNGPQRPENAPTGMLDQFREVVKTPPAGTPGPVTPPALLAGASGGTGQADAAGAAAPGSCGGGHGPTPSGLVGAPPRIGVTPCRHESPLGIDALASCANCQAYRLAAIAAGVEPPRRFPGVLRCGHRMESMDLCCQMCAEHVVSIEAAMGGEDPAREIGGGIGRPLRPDPALYLRVDPGSYLRIAADGLFRRITGGGRSALSLTEAIQAAQMLDMFFPRDKVMGLADGDLSWFRRSWTYHHAGHLDKPDPFWRYQPLMTVASALGVAPVSGMRLATGASPAPAPADDRGWGEHSRGYYGEYARHGHAEWRGEGSWDDWYGCGAWGGRGWYQEQAYGYDTGSDDASRGSRRPRSPSGRPRRPSDSGPDDSRSDGRGGSRRRRLSSVGVGGGSSAFACDLRLGFLGGVTDVDDGCLVGLHDSRGFPRSAMVTRGEWLRRYQLTTDEGGPVADTGALPVGSSLPLSTNGLPAVSCHPVPWTCPLLEGPFCWRSPCRTGVSHPGPLSRSPGLNGRADTARCWTPMSLVIAPPMEE